MNKKVSTILISLLTLLMFINLISPFNGTWNIHYVNEVSVTPTISKSLPTCIYKKTDTNGNVTIKNYLSLELALKEANETSLTETSYTHEVKVKPSTNTIIISKNITINKGVTLSLEYEDEETSDKKYLYQIADTDEFESNSTKVLDSNIQSNSSTTDVYSYGTKCLEVKLKEDKTITNNGILRIGGSQSGSGTNNIAGFVTNYAQLTLSSGSKLINNGTLSCFGYIVGSDNSYSSTDDCTDKLSQSIVQIELNENSKTYLPFVDVEHRGGGTFTSLFTAGLKGSPFNRFYFPNISKAIIKMTNNYFYAIPDLFAGNQHNRCIVNLIGNDSSFLLQSSNFEIYGYFQFCEVTKSNSTIKKPNHNLLFATGDINLNTLSLTIMGADSISTQYCYFPISCYYSLRFKCDSLKSANQKIKLLPGAQFYIEDSCKMNLNSFVVYNETIVNKIYGVSTNGISYLKGINNNCNYEQSDEAICYVNGTLNISNYSGGYFRTSSSNGILLFAETGDIMYEVSSSSNSYVYSSEGFKASGLSSSSSSVASTLECGAYSSLGAYWQNLMSPSLIVKDVNDIEITTYTWKNVCPGKLTLFAHTSILKEDFLKIDSYEWTLVKKANNMEKKYNTAKGYLDTDPTLDNFSPSNDSCKLELPKNWSTFYAITFDVSCKISFHLLSNENVQLYVETSHTFTLEIYSVSTPNLTYKSSSLEEDMLEDDKSTVYSSTGETFSYDDYYSIKFTITFPSQLNFYGIKELYFIYNIGSKPSATTGNRITECEANNGYVAPNTFSVPFYFKKLSEGPDTYNTSDENITIVYGVLVKKSPFTTATAQFKFYLKAFLSTGNPKTPDYSNIKSLYLWRTTNGVITLTTS